MISVLISIVRVSVYYYMNDVIEKEFTWWGTEYNRHKRYKLLCFSSIGSIDLPFQYFSILLFPIIRCRNILWCEMSEDKQFQEGISLLA